MKRLVKFSLFVLVLLVATPTHAARIKDVSRIDGVRANQLIGYGLVVGLDQTGDSRRTSFTGQSLAAMLSRMGIRIDKADLLLRNIAAVMVTASLPPFAQPGTPMDISVSSIGDAKSLVGGTL
ncbi:MAG: flagellar basal body P-ring protein FlgI, partial [Myxococcota bacterium]|nr:flagellar basal body P-ring protein FlgI [Myxococcota bacterium]